MPIEVKWKNMFGESLLSQTIDAANGSSDTIPINNNGTRHGLILRESADSSGQEQRR
jgi:hypothetical protein